MAGRMDRLLAEAAAAAMEALALAVRLVTYGFRATSQRTTLPSSLMKHCARATIEPSV
jgi:hypothetical protein